MNRKQEATREELRSRKADEICFLIQKYSYNEKHGFLSSSPRFCLRFIDEPSKIVASKLKNGGSWYFTLHPAYESNLVTGTSALEVLKELESINEHRYWHENSDLGDDEIAKILLKFGLIGIEVKYIFTEVDDRLEEIREIPSNKILYSVVGDELVLQMKKLGKDKSRKVAKREKNNGQHRRHETQRQA